MTPIEIAGASPDTATLPIGAPGPAFNDLLGTDSQRYGTSTYADRAALVLIFSSNRCPTAKAYGERMKALQRDYGPRGVQLIALNSVDPTLYPDESYPRMVDRAAEDGYNFPYLVDDGQRVARAYGATCTFHVFVLDHDRNLRYEGRFDDSRLATNATSQDLRNALDDVLAGRSVRVLKTTPFGCSLDFLRPSDGVQDFESRRQGLPGRSADLASPVPSIGFPAMAMVLIAGAWLVVLVAQATGSAGVLHHHALIDGGPPLWLAVPAFVLSWLVMIAAMMLPSSLPTIRVVDAVIDKLTQPRRARAAFLGGFALAWTAFGLLAFMGDEVLHLVADATPWLAARPWLIEASILGLAGAYQFAPLKRRSLAACCQPLSQFSFDPAGRRGSFSMGLDHGLACLGSSWALMILMFAEGFANLWWMVPLTAVMVYETSGRHGQRVGPAIGIALILAALTVLSGPLL